MLDTFAKLHHHLPCINRCEFHTRHDRVDVVGAPRLRIHQRLIRSCERYLGVHCYRVRIRPLDRAARASRNPPENIEIRQATERELWCATANPTLGLSRDFLEHALARGDCSFAAFEDGNMVAYTWRTTGAAPHSDGLRVSVSPPYVYGYKGLTLPSHRGLRLNIIVNDAANAAFLRQGYAHMIGFVALYNAAKLANSREHEFETVGYAGYLRWFGRVMPFRTPGARRVGFRFYKPVNPQQL